MVRQQDKCIDTDWASLEFQDTKLGDRRLTSRLIKLANRMSESPESHINQACDLWSETKAAYRFFKNDKVSESEILAAHVEQTVKRTCKLNVILAIQDTCFISYDSHKETSGLGIIGDEPIRYGLTMHSAFAVTTDGLPLGLLDQKIIAEQRSKKKRTKEEQRDARIETKKTFKWLESLQNTNFSMSEQPTQVVTVCDREADFYELFKLCYEDGTSLLVRAKANRKINKTARHSVSSGEYLWQHIESSPSKGKIQIEIPSSGGRRKRKALLEVRFGQIIVHAPTGTRSLKSDELPVLKLSAVHVVEQNPPKGAVRLEWMLLTDLGVNNFDEAVEKVKWYSMRWKIEVLHKILKSGFNVEKCRLNDAKRLVRYLTVMSVIAWRIYWVNLIARSSPQTPCSELLTDSEWKVLYSKFNRGAAIPKQPPTITIAVRWIAQLGGFLARKGDGNPGVTTLWRGWKRLHDLSDGWALAGL